MCFRELSEKRSSLEWRLSRHWITQCFSTILTSTFLATFILVSFKEHFSSDFIGTYSQAHWAGKKGRLLVGSRQGALPIISRLWLHRPSHTLPLWYISYVCLTSSNCFKQDKMGLELSNKVWHQWPRLQSCGFLLQYHHNLQWACWLQKQLYLGQCNCNVDQRHTSLVANVSLSNLPIPH